MLLTSALLALQIWAHREETAKEEEETSEDEPTEGHASQTETKKEA